MTCYADDTMVLATGDYVEKALCSADAGTLNIIWRVEDLELRVSVEKTEAVLFHRPRRRPREMPMLNLGNTPVHVGTSMKYLGSVLDNPWSFVGHFRKLAPRAEKIAAAFSHLMPNLEGPEVRLRWLYANVVYSVLLYGPSIWATDLARSKVGQRLLGQVQRGSNLGLTGNIPAVFQTAAEVLVGVPLLRLPATHLKCFWVPPRFRTEGIEVSSATLNNTATKAMVDAWKVEMQGR